MPLRRTATVLVLAALAVGAASCGDSEEVRVGKQVNKELGTDFVRCDQNGVGDIPSLYGYPGGLVYEYNREGEGEASVRAPVIDDGSEFVLVEEYDVQGWWAEVSLCVGAGVC